MNIRFFSEIIALEVYSKSGSGYWIRTSDQVINSHLLYR